MLSIRARKPPAETCRTPVASGVAPSSSSRVDPPGVQAREQRGRVDPRVAKPAVLDVLDARERHRAPGAIVGEQAVAHLAPARPAGGRRAG